MSWFGKFWQYNFEYVTTKDRSQFLFNNKIFNAIALTECFVESLLGYIVGSVHCRCIAMIRIENAVAAAIIFANSTFIMHESHES